MDNTIRLWDVKTGKCIGILDGHLDWVNSVACHPNGKTIVSASEDYTIMIWKFLPLQEIIEDVYQLLINTPLTPEERREYYLE
jgi:WD40 repeat protein